MTTSFQSNGKHYLAVTVPEYSKSFAIKVDSLYGEYFNYLEWTNSDNSIESKNLPDGQYTILGLASEMSEEQWKEIVDKSDRENTKDNYKEYECGSVYITCVNAKASGQSLIRSLNLNPETTLIIEKR